MNHKGHKEHQEIREIQPWGVGWLAIVDLPRFAFLPPIPVLLLRVLCALCGLI
jgi:hypothetical protein